MKQIPPEAVLLYGRVPDGVVAIEFGIPVDKITDDREMIGIKPYRYKTVDSMTFCREWQAAGSIRELCGKVRMNPSAAANRAAILRTKGIILKELTTGREEFWSLLRKEINGVANEQPVDAGNVSQIGEDAGQGNCHGTENQHRSGRPDEEEAGYSGVPTESEISPLDAGRNGHARSAAGLRGRPSRQS